MFKLAKRYQTGNEIEEDLYLAFRLILFTAKHHYKPAYTGLGRCYAYSIGTQQDIVEAVHWFLKTDYLQDIDVLEFMALCYHTGIGVPQDTTKAYDLWLDPVEKGHPDSFHYCQLVANVGYPRGQFMLGHHYQHGIDTPANIQVALQLFHQAAEQGYAPAQCRLGILYSEGNYGIARGPEVAVKWFQLATHQNNPVAISRLAYCLYDGDGITQNKDEAAKLWYTLSKPTNDYPKGNPAGQYGLGLVLTDKDYTGYNPKKGIKELHKAAKQDFVLAQYLLGMFYYNGLDDAVKQDYKQARYWLNKAAKQGDHIAQYHMGEIYYNGNDVSINYRKAYQYYRQSADGCYIPAMQKLAHLCLEGIGTKKDEAEGYHLLAMLANNSDEEALTLLRNAAMSGNHYAENAMWIYLQENGNYESGHTWLKQSAGNEFRFLFVIQYSWSRRCLPFLTM